MGTRVIKALQGGCGTHEHDAQAGSRARHGCDRRRGARSQCSGPRLRRHQLAVRWLRKGSIPPLTEIIRAAEAGTTRTPLRVESHQLSLRKVPTTTREIHTPGSFRVSRPQGGSSRPETPFWPIVYPSWKRVSASYSAFRTAT